MTATTASMKRLDDLFRTVRLENESKNGEHVHFNPIVVVTKDCDLHGRRGHATLATSRATGYKGRNATGSDYYYSSSPRADVSLSALNDNMNGVGRKLNDPRDAKYSRRFSTDSLDSLPRNSNRRKSPNNSINFDDPIWEENNAGGEVRSCLKSLEKNAL